mgnify:CR=1 FL=1
MIMQNSAAAKTLALLGLGLLLGACSALKPPAFVAVNPENLNEWEMEGSLTVHTAEGKYKTHFRYREVDGQYWLTILPKSLRRGPQAVLGGDLGSSEASLQPGADSKAADIAMALSNTVPMDRFGYWLRGLPTSGNAIISAADADRTGRIEEDGWSAEYDKHMQVQRYYLPEKMSLRDQNKRGVDIKALRAETGFLTSPCEGLSAAGLATSDNASGYSLDRLVPADGSAPVPRWVDKDAFCRQLIKVHGKVPDPLVGLYGPDSMMWKLMAPLAPNGFGAGRALLLQTAHPWVTAAIDQHSIVRHDPVERARRTFNNVFTMVYGSMPQVMASAHQVHRVHEEIQGKIGYHAGAFERGSEYRANEINSMIWVYATLWETQVYMYETLVKKLSTEEKERYYQETKLFAMLFGIPEDALPSSWKEFIAYNRAMWHSPQLTITDNTLALRDDLLRPRSIFLVFPMWLQKVTIAETMPAPIAEGYQMEPTWWTGMNWFWIKNGARVAPWFLPHAIDYNAIHHEAHARLEGKRVGWFQRKIIKTLLGKERLVN